MSARQVRRFELERDIDVSGVSGTGTVAYGAQAPDGTCVLWWDSVHDSIGIYPTMETLLAIHGHGGKTRVVYIDGVDQPGGGLPSGSGAPGAPTMAGAPMSGVAAGGPTGPGASGPPVQGVGGVPAVPAVPSSVGGAKRPTLAGAAPRSGPTVRVASAGHPAAAGHVSRSSPGRPAGDGR